MNTITLRKLRASCMWKNGIRYFSAPAAIKDAAADDHTELSVRYKGLYVRVGSEAVCAGCGVPKSCKDNFGNFVKHLALCKPMSKLLSPKDQLRHRDKPSEAVAPVVGAAAAPLLFKAPTATAGNDHLTDCLVCLICLGKLSINWVSSEAAAYVARGFMGRVDVTLPSPRTVARHAFRLFDAYLQEISGMLDDVRYISATADGWSDPKLASYQGLTLHFVDASWTLRSISAGLTRTIGIKNREAIMATFSAQLERLHATHKLDSVVTDSAAVNEGAFDINTTLSQVFCVAHSLDNALKHAVKDNALSAILDHAKALTTFIRQSGKRREALLAAGARSIPPAWNPTRFTGVFFTLQGVLRVVEVCENLISRSTRKQDAFYSDTRNVAESVEALLDCAAEIQAVLPALEKVVVWTQHLSSRSTATISMLGTALDSLLATIDGLLGSDKLQLPVTAAKTGKRREPVKVFGVVEARAFLQKLRENVVTYVTPTAGSHLSIIAQALDPRTFRRVADTMPKRKEIYTMLKQVGAVTAEELERNSEADVPSSTWDDNVKVYATAVTAVLALSEPELKKLDPFKWWSTQGAMPIFQRCARRILCIPATSSDCERLFSLAGRVVTPERSALGPVNAEVFTLLATWLKTLPPPWSATITAGRIRPFSADALALLPAGLLLRGVSGPPVTPEDHGGDITEEDDPIPEYNSEEVNDAGASASAIEY